jgi:hypothetical protein
MNYYVIVVMMTFFVIITHKDIKNIDLGLKALFLRVVLSLLLTSIPVYSNEPHFFSEPDKVSIYVMVWLLIIISYVLHWMYRKKQSNVSN